MVGGQSGRLTLGFMPSVTYAKIHYQNSAFCHLMKGARPRRCAQRKYIRVC